MASAHPAADVCTSAGLSTTAAVRAYGPGARVRPLPLIGYGPAALMNIPACFVYARGNAVVATVQRYPVEDRQKLLEIYEGLNATQTRVQALGVGAELFDVLARPRNYEEVVLFSGATYLIAARIPLVVRAAPPPSPPAKLLTLLRGIRGRLDTAR